MTKAKLDSNLIATVAGDIVVFNFDGESLEFTGESTEYLAVGVGIPANSTIDKPDSPKEGYAICRDVISSTWVYIEDRRGETVYSIETGIEMEVHSLGGYPDNTTTQKPLTPYDRWNGNNWVTDTEAQHAAEVKLASNNKRELLQEAHEKINFWQTELLLGSISDSDKDNLKKWVEYIKNLQAIDVNNAPGIQWPEPPEL
ncbi:tail fiber assembly protein [Klebsiella aerogenes]